MFCKTRLGYSTMRGGDGNGQQPTPCMLACNLHASAYMLPSSLMLVLINAFSAHAQLILRMRRVCVFFHSYQKSRLSLSSPSKTALQYMCIGLNRKHSLLRIFNLCERRPWRSTAFMDLVIGRLNISSQ
jgi:hypothetical protein